MPIPADVAEPVTDLNRVVLEGRVSRAPETRELPSGDVVVVLNVVVRRGHGSRVDSLPVSVGPPPGRGGRRQPGQPTARTLRQAQRLRVDDRVRVEGTLERRFWSTGGQRRTRLAVAAEELVRR